MQKSTEEIIVFEGITQQNHQRLKLVITKN